MMVSRGFGVYNRSAPSCILKTMIILRGVMAYEVRGAIPCSDIRVAALHAKPEEFAKRGWKTT